MSSIKSGWRRAGIVGLSTLVAGSMMTFTAATAQADWATAGGDIGLVDTNTTAPGTQGATLVQPNLAGQALGDMRVVVPNVFKAGDTIDFAIFDRTATVTDNGLINANSDHKLGFSGTPTVTVNPTPFVVGTKVGPTSGVAGNTENAPVADTAATKATTPPSFTAALVSSSRGAGVGATDIIRLTVHNLGAGDATDVWAFALSGVKADLGPAVSPGELRVVPFAYNGAPATNFSNASKVFDGNLADTDGLAGFDPTIKLYTVPAYVSPVTFNIGSPSNIVADNTTQSVGDITIAETNNFSLQTGLYSVTVGSAIIKNTSTSPVTVTTTNAATGEVVTSTGVPVGNAIQFNLAGASNTSKLSIKLSGLLLSDALKGPITYTLSGGSIDNGPNAFLVTAGTSGVIGSPPPNGVLADLAFVTPGGRVNQLDIQAPPLTINAVSTPIAFRIGGIDRYETAEKIALAGAADQPTAILASGELFPDALSSSYLASETGASILLTKHNVIPAVTLEGLRLLGVHTVYLIGGTGAINSAVEAQLRNTSQYYPGGEVTFGQGKLLVVRLGGADRYATNKIVNLKASALSTDLNPVGRTSITFGQASKLTALVATGENFPDALAGGPATEGNGTGNLPLILTPTGALTSSASSQLTGLGIEQAVILGKEGAVSAAVETSITGLGVASKRIGGADRYETATLVADFEMADPTPTATVTGGLGFIANRVFLARGDDFPDALAAGPLAGGLGAPIVLTNPNTLTPVTKTWLTANAARLDFATALGLGGAVSAAVLNAANAALGG